VITTQLPDGTTVHHQHDQAGRLTYNKYTDGRWEAWEYDKVGRLTKAYNRDSVTEFVRNALGQVIKETQDGRTVEHRYDDRSRLSHIVSALGEILPTDMMQKALSTTYQLACQGERSLGRRI